MGLGHRAIGIGDERQELVAQVIQREEIATFEQLAHENTSQFTSSLWVKNDFNVAIDPLIEFLKGSGRLRERQAMRNDLTRLGTTSDNHIAQLGVVALIMIAAHANGDSFTEERWPGDEHIPAFFD